VGCGLGAHVCGNPHVRRRKALQTPPGSRAEKRSLGIGAFARLLAPFVVLLIAFLVGIVTESLDAFIVVSAAGLALWLVLRFTIWR
jgi:hypothetical protein